MKQKLNQLKLRIQQLIKRGKPTANDILEWLVLAVIMYCVWSFAHWDLEAPNWSKASRWWYGFTVVGLALFVHMTEDKKQA